MRIPILLASAVLAISSLAGTRADLDPAFGNTVTSTYPSGRVAKLWLERDGTFEGQRTRGQRMGGTWSVNNRGELCLRQRRPTPVPFSYCTPIVEGGIGTRWTARAPTGETVQNELVRGQGGR